VERQRRRRARVEDVRRTATVVGAVVLRPWLWPAALSTVFRLARPGWWHRWPPVPRPDDALWRFRMETVYGGDGHGVPEAGDLTSFLGWIRSMHRWRRR
jgi:hypothetical protein